MDQTDVCPLRPEGLAPLQQGPPRNCRNRLVRFIFCREAGMDENFVQDDPFNRGDYN